MGRIGKGEKEMIEQLMLVELRELKLLFYLRTNNFNAYALAELFNGYSTLPVYDLYIDPKEMDVTHLQFYFQLRQDEIAFKMSHIGSYTVIKKDIN